MSLIIRFDQCNEGATVANNQSTVQSINRTVFSKNLAFLFIPAKSFCLKDWKLSLLLVMVEKGGLVGRVKRRCKWLLSLFARTYSPSLRICWYGTCVRKEDWRGMSTWYFWRASTSINQLESPSFSRQKKIKNGNLGLNTPLLTAIQVSKICEIKLLNTPRFTIQLIALLWWPMYSNQMKTHRNPKRSLLPQRHISPFLSQRWVKASVVSASWSVLCISSMLEFVLEMERVSL